MTSQTNNPLWFKDAIIYALPVHAFYDSNGSGIGDINGLIEKLDYLEDLGVNCISLLPFYESPLKDDGYDVSDFKQVHPNYGALEDFQRFLEEAHKRGIYVVIDIIMNHTSTEHEWFKRARMAAEGDPERDFYIWSPTPEPFSDAQIIFSDYETSNWEWDNQAKSYYWHRFYSHQADLNYNNPRVREEIRGVIDFWFNLGVDGLRLTSVMFIFREEGTNCENLPQVHEYLRELRRYVDQKHPNKILVAETNLWPEEAAEYYGAGDECHMNYHFPLMPRLYMGLQTEDRYPIIDILEQTPTVPENCQWALFLRNHDDLMLSMVTEEERDYLYKVFAQDHGAKINEGIRRRLAPLLNNDRRKIELLNSLLFSLPGTPVIYYGDEIGMGDNIYLGDRNGVRTPMQWNSDRNAGFSAANPQKLFLPVIRDPLYRYEAINVEIQNRNSSSLLWWMKNIISMRKRLKAFSHGKIEFLDSLNGKVLSFIRSYEGESILVVANLSKFSQAIALDLSRYKGIRPMEIFSQNKFFPISAGEPYQFTVGPYGYYWFLMEQGEEAEEVPKERAIQEATADVDWAGFFDNYSAKRRFEKKILPGYLRSCRWFGGKSRKMVSINVAHYPSVSYGEAHAFFLSIQVRYTDGLPETYFLPITFVSDAGQMVHYLKNEVQSVVCYLKTPEKEGILVDAIYDEAFRNDLFCRIKGHERVNVQGGQLAFEAGKTLNELQIEPEDVVSEVLRAEQSNTSVIYNNQFFFKIYRKLDIDINPDLEVVRYLSEQTAFSHSPRYGGGVQFEDTIEKSFTILGLLQNKIPNQGEAWTMMLEALNRYYEKVLAKVERDTPPPALVEKNRLYFEDTPERLQRLIGSVIYERAALLGQRTAEMHIALAQETTDPAFAPERFTQNYQRSIYAQHRKLVNEKLSALERRLPSLPEHIASEARQVLDIREEIMAAFSEIYSRKIEATKTRVHGDYHLGQVLFNGRDFYIIDFEGEPMHSISERRLKRTPFKDVAGMIRSFHYAAYGQLVLNQNYRAADMPQLEAWANQWFHYVSQYFLTAYLDTAAGQHFIPEDLQAMQLLLRIYILEKAIYEVGYEMNARPEWLRIPVRGVLYAMQQYRGQAGSTMEGRGDE
ncbi:maltose alpha-D-glucosyltransferase [Phaeodactylibacter luteus]|uniref:Maltokinase n=1 Tax=Phaeodactylibacter luteus TaxID=1564516 RepID=A0A5C6RIH7_9BACT|nr:maltose alpha-D-glucosyltransferase [Phaeodactylibacter luteus]TXB61923.1 maltose alpha-D-glucosyltransferase [Phaeodactylibacter luteus]